MRSIVLFKMVFCLALMHVSALSLLADSEIDNYDYAWSLEDSCVKTPADEQKLLQEYSLYREFFKQENYTDAIKHWRWVMANAPGYRETPFFDGITMYEFFIDAEKDSVKREFLIDTLMMLYDKRIDCHGKEGYVLGRKAYSMYKMRPKDYANVYNTFKKSVNIQGDKSEYFLLVPYFNYSVIMWKLREVEPSTVLETYDQIMAIIDANVAAKTEDAANYEKIRPAIDQMLPEKLMSCEYLIGRYNERWETDKNDLHLVTAYFNGLRTAKDSLGNGCTDSEVYLNVLKQLHTLNPSPGTAEQLAILLFKEGKETEAIEMFNNAISLEADNNKKADWCLNIARILRQQGKYSQARTYAYKTLEFKPDWGAPYMLIGDMYASSGSLCGPGTGFDSQVVVWVAIDKYYKAKAVDASFTDEANAQIAKYSQYMPTKTDLFDRGIDEGSSYTVGCWINETTTVRGRKTN
ncbi:MAG: hypothetical protein ACK4IY_00140 [Chitinophagales bacterium]